MLNQSLEGLIERVEKAEGPSRELDVLIECLTGGGYDYSYGHRPSKAPGRVVAYHRNGGRSGTYNAPRYTHSVDSALGLLDRMLPGWTWRLASCSVSDDAWVCPDFNHPVHGPAFEAMFGAAFGDRDPAEAIMEATDIARHPPGQPALTLIEAMLRGMATLRALQHSKTGDAA